MNDLFVFQKVYLFFIWGWDLLLEKCFYLWRFCHSETGLGHFFLDFIRFPILQFVSWYLIKFQVVSQTRNWTVVNGDPGLLLVLDLVCILALFTSSASEQEEIVLCSGLHFELTGRVSLLGTSWHQPDVPQSDGSAAFRSPVCMAFKKKTTNWVPWIQESRQGAVGTDGCHVIPVSSRRLPLVCKQVKVVAVLQNLDNFF